LSTEGSTVASDIDYDSRIRSSFAKQGHMTAVGATIGPISYGSVEIALRPSAATSQQHGFVHGGIVSAIADTAAGYAALTVMPPGTGVLTIEFKINFIAPAAGDRIIARGRVVKAGRTLVLTQADVFADTDGKEKPIALLTGTMMVIQDREGVSD
jgi:uncharacterized protein (TIGR00369 family)